jgi:hypothetical protein
MKSKLNVASIVSIILDSLVLIVWMIEALQEGTHYNINIFFAFLGLSLISEGVTQYRFGKLINKSSTSNKYSRWLVLFLGVAMLTISTFRIVSGNFN